MQIGSRWSLVVKIVATGAGLILISLQAGCAATGYAHWDVAADDARGMIQADSACDFNRGSNDLGSVCYVSRRPWGDPPSPSR
jgi:hypothetical protein